MGAAERCGSTEPERIAMFAFVRCRNGTRNLSIACPANPARRSKVTDAIMITRTVNDAPTANP